ncbi:MAG TPA: hypothetical protein VLI54_05165 [Bacillota bacterium]|nr:hypothetical protein [Bacillota bacterium]
MHTTAKWYLAGFLAVLLSFCSARSAHAASAAGISITPAAFTLELPKGQYTQHQSFTVTNQYASPVVLRFMFQTSDNNVAQAAQADPAKQLALTTTDLTLAAGATATQTVTLTDSDQLAPGSQLVDLVVSEIVGPAAHISAVPSVRMPLILVKDDGAVSSIAASKLTLGGLHMSMPNTLSVTLQNRGNMIVNPHGVITLTDAKGKEVGKGVLNNDAQALMPGAKASYAVAVTPLSASILLGNYHATLSYGLGGGESVQLTSAKFFYVGWRHIAAVVGIAVLLYVGVQLVVRIYKNPLALRRLALARRGAP